MTSPSAPILLVSTDSHIGAPLDSYRPYLESRYHELFDEQEAHTRDMLDLLKRSTQRRPHQLEFSDDEQAFRSGGEDGAWDPARRLQEMDREGIVWELANPFCNDSSTFYLPPFVADAEFPAETRVAGARAYNRWLADMTSATDGRVQGAAELGPFVDLDEAVTELAWLAENDFVTVTPPSAPLLDERYERIWAACADLGLVLNFHAGWGGDPVVALNAAREVMRKMAEDADRTSAKFQQAVADASGGKEPDLQVGSRRPMWQLMLSGVLDRHPRLKIAFAEIRTEWVPATVAYLQRWVAEAPAAQRPNLDPAEYWSRNFRITGSFMRRLEVDMRSEIGVGHLMFGRDYPHPEGTWPNTLDWIRDAFRGVPEAEARAILGENALEWYGLDRSRLTEIAKRIGPAPDSILGDHPVDERKVRSFVELSGYGKPAIQVRDDTMEAALAEDFAPA